MFAGLSSLRAQEEERKKPREPTEADRQLQAYLASNYGDGGGEEMLRDKKRRKKRRRDGSGGIRVVEDDDGSGALAAPIPGRPPSTASLLPLNNESEEEDGPVVVNEGELGEEIGRIKREQDYFKKEEDGRGWEQADRGPSGGASPQRRGRRDSDDDPSPPRRGRHDSDDDPSPPRRGRHDSDDDPSPPRRGRHDSDDDPSPPRRGRHDSDDDPSPPRRDRRDSDDDPSPPRRDRRDSDDDPSPPRRGRRDSDDDPSPPRRGRRDSDDDPSPPRRGRRDSDDDPSPPRRGRRDSDDDPSPSRRTGFAPRLPSRIAERMSDGTRAGMTRGSEIAAEMAQKQETEARRFAALDESQTGRGAQTVYRDREGRRVSREKLEGEREGDGRIPESALPWGGGLRQREERERKEEAARRANADTASRLAARHELDRREQRKSRWGDPLAGLGGDERGRIRRELEEEAERGEARVLGRLRGEGGETTGAPAAADGASGAPAFVIPRGIPTHSWIKRGIGAAPNRYGIQPGRFWDGVDRSNGFEAARAKRQNELSRRRAEARAASRGDM